MRTVHSHQSRITSHREAFNRMFKGHEQVSRVRVGVDNSQVVKTLQRHQQLLANRSRLSIRDGIVQAGRNIWPHWLEDQAVMHTVWTYMLEAIQKCDNMASRRVVGIEDSTIYLNFSRRIRCPGAYDLNRDVPKSTAFHFVSR